MTDEYAIHVEASSRDRIGMIDKLREEIQDIEEVEDVEVELLP